MKRASKLSTPEDFAVEERRERIRDSRTRRAMSVVLCVSLASSLPSADDDILHYLSNLFRVLGGT
ncbi:MAG TPA: hypothetical protein VGW80_00040 [Solirubrobacterales bacterium]|jgi:hypothetical protein|nr:hypothetical protein [Solirubrobacterales bacterium]